MCPIYVALGARAHSRGARNAGGGRSPPSGLLRDLLHGLLRGALHPGFPHRSLRRRNAAALEPHPELAATTGPGDGLRLDERLGLDQVAELGEAIAARVERRVGAVQVAAESAERGPVLVVGVNLVQRLGEHALDRARLVITSLAGLVHLVRSGGLALGEHLEEHELLARL